MKQLGPLELYDTVENTWPPATCSVVEPWTIRDGQNGGQRVSAATLRSTFKIEDIAKAEREMIALGQPKLFMIRNGDDDLDAALDKQGYVIKDPVTLYSCPTATLTVLKPGDVSSFSIWPPLQIMRNIWAEGGIDENRINVMNRVSGPKTGILSRQVGRAAGTAFVGIHNGIAMLHALEVLPALRRNGAGINMMLAAAHWAENHGAHTFSLVVTSANVGANALYTRLGMTVAGHYHYRIKQ